MHARMMHARMEVYVLDSGVWRGHGAWDGVEWYVEWYVEWAWCVAANKRVMGW